MRKKKQDISLSTSAKNNLKKTESRYDNALIPARPSLKTLHSVAKQTEYAKQRFVDNDMRGMMIALKGLTKNQRPFTSKLDVEYSSLERVAVTVEYLAQCRIAYLFHIQEVNNLNRRQSDILNRKLAGEKISVEDQGVLEMMEPCIDQATFEIGKSFDVNTPETVIIRRTKLFNSIVTNGLARLTLEASMPTLMTKYTQDMMGQSSQQRNTAVSQLMALINSNKEPNQVNIHLSQTIPQPPPPRTGKRGRKKGSKAQGEEKKPKQHIVEINPSVSNE